jgi:hypothetical protein
MSRKRNSKMDSHQLLTIVGYFLRRKSISLLVTPCLSMFKAGNIACSGPFEDLVNIQPVAPEDNHEDKKEWRNSRSIRFDSSVSEATNHTRSGYKYSDQRLLGGA